MDLKRYGLSLSHRIFKMLSPKMRQRIVSPFIWYSRRYCDYHLVSYPKCGRTWLRMMIGYCLVHHFNLPIKQYLEIDLLSFMDGEIPLIGVSHDGTPQFKRPDDLPRSKKRYRSQNVIFLTRDPRDVIVSNYFQQTKRRETFEGNIEEFVRRETGGLRTLLTFYRIWYDRRDVPDDFLLVRYEDLQEDVETVLDGLLEFMGLDDIEQRIRSCAIDEASFENMRRIEKSAKSGNFRLQPGDPDDPESYKVRKGKVGGYEEYLDPDTIAYVEEQMAKLLPGFYGYSPNTD